MKKVIIGLLTITPLAIMMSLTVKIFTFMPRMIANQGTINETIFSNYFTSIFIYQGISVLVIIGLLIFYVKHAIENKILSSEMRIVWIILFFFSNVLAMMVYWFIYILKEVDESIDI